MLLQLLFVLVAIIVGARLGGIGLGVMGGVGLGILTFVFGLQPTAPPIDVMLMIAAVISAAAEQQEQDDDPPAVAAEAIGIAIHSQEPPVWILSTRLIPCYDGGPQKCRRRDKKQEPLHQQRLWLCKKTGINSRDACSYEQLRTSASA